MADVHTPVIPDVLPPDRINATIWLPNTNEPEPVQIVKLSPLGVSVRLPKTISIDHGAAVDLELVVDGTRNQHHGIIVAESGEDESIVGVRFAESSASETTTFGSERRASKRWICTDAFLPYAIAASPAQYNEFIQFVVRDVSHTGLLLSCSLSNKYLLPNTQLEMTLTFPLVGTANIRGKITRVQIASAQGKEHLFVGLMFTRLSRNAQSAINQYLELFTEAGLSEHDTKVSTKSKGVQIYYARTEDELKEAIILRNSFYENQESTSTFDNDARILIAKFNGKQIATARIRLPNLTDKLVTGDQKHLPVLTELIEVSAVAVTEEYSIEKVLPLIFQSITVSCVTSSRPFLLVHSNTKIESSLKQMGFDQAPQTTELLITNAVQALTGVGVSPRVWHLVWREVAIHMIDQGLLSPNGVERILIRGYRLFGPLLGLIKPRL